MNLATLKIGTVNSKNLIELARFWGDSQIKNTKLFTMTNLNSQNMFLKKSQNKSLYILLILLMFGKFNTWDGVGW